MVGFEGYLHLAELPGDILRRSLQSSAGQLGQHLLPGRTGDVYARPGGLSYGRQRLFEGRPFAGVRDVQPPPYSTDDTVTCSRIPEIVARPYSGV